MITKNCKKSNKKVDNQIFSDKKSEKSDENTQFFDENTRTNEIHIHCLVNRSHPLKHPTDKKRLDRNYYAHHNYTREQIPLNSVIEETLLKGFQFVPGEFIENPDPDIGIRNAENWKSQQLFLIEFDESTENTLAQFITARPFLQENAWFITESLRSRYDDPDDDTCNGQLRPRIAFCMPCPVNTKTEREWIYTALVKDMPGCDDGSANSITNGGLGNANPNAVYIKIGKIVDTEWFNLAINTGKKAEAEKQAQRQRTEQERKRKQAERAAMGFTEREGELPLEALAKADPSLFLESIGLSLKSESGQYKHWGRTEKRGDTALSIWKSAQGNWQICVFANSIPTPSSVSGAMPLTRFYCYHELNTDIEGLQPDSQQWKDINAELASRGYGTWLSDDEFHAKQPQKEKRTYTPPKRLEIKETEQERYKDTLLRPEANNQALLTFILNILNNIETYDTTHLFIVKFETGAGKSYTTLTNARKLGKKVLSLLFNHDLAAEQTNTAKTLGYNAYRFRGRSYNFDDSNLRSLPLQMREQNETLFRDKDVMCPVYDKLEPYQHKRLNPYMMCFSCPLLNACKSEGYWSQFPEIRHVDYLSACIQDILFNPDFWTLLDTFLSGSVPFEVPETDEEAAIAAMLGLQDNDDTPSTFQPFDVAMIDDYTTAGLYSEAQYTLEEIHNLTKAWAGTSTGEVLKQIFEAILMLYHPEGTQKSVDILTNLFDSLDDETRERVNTHLTKHADRDEYGVIPTSPWTAMKNGIATLETLTPVWHSKDWTLLHQLETLINHCKNTTQAPMFIDNDGNITLVMPPQVHPKIRAVLLMSATANFPGTKNAFRGQNVKLTASEGKPSHWADGVKAFQYINARWTTQSIFAFKQDENGKTLYEDGKPIIKGLKPKAIAMLQKLIELARADSRKCVFIGYKDFVEGEIAELPVVKALHEAFDTVTHYDIAPGMNFEGYKIFVTFGYPKVDRKTIKREARIQHAHDPEPLNFEYDTTTEQGEVYSSTHGRYTDPRVENIRQQLTTQKKQQAVGRARHTRWEDTITIDFSAEPVQGFTELATPFTDADWRNTENFDLDAAIAANATRSVKETAEQDGVSERTAYRRTEKQRSDDRTELAIKAKELMRSGLSERKAAKQLGISRNKLKGLLE